jgi:hypothetical protein
MRMEGLFRALRKAKHLKDAETRLPGTHPVLGPVQIFLMTLRADPTARLTGHVVLADSPTLGMDFPNAVSLLPLGMSGKHVKLWMSEKDSLPARVMFSTRSFGVLSFDITYILRKDAHGLEYLLPDLITLQPLEDEDLPPTAFPVRVHFTNYKINLEVPDAAFE